MVWASCSNSPVLDSLACVVILWSFPLSRHQRIALIPRKNVWSRSQTFSFSDISQGYHQRTFLPSVVCSQTCKFIGRIPQRSSIEELDIKVPQEVAKNEPQFHIGQIASYTPSRPEGERLGSLFDIGFVRLVRPPFRYVRVGLFEIRRTVRCGPGADAHGSLYW